MRRSNKLAAIKRAAWMILGLLIAYASLEPQFAPAGVRGQQRDEKRKASETVKLSADIIDRRQCIQVLGDGARDELLRLQLRFRITNVSADPIIIHRYAHGVFNVRLGKTPAELRAEHFVYDARSTFMPLSRISTRDFNEVSLTDEFRVLKPKESFEYEYPENVDITVVESTTGSQTLPAGEYYLQTKVATWMWEVEKAQRLQQQWAKHGQFFYSNVTSEPIALRVDRAGTTTARCDSLSRAN